MASVSADDGYTTPRETVLHHGLAVEAYAQAMAHVRYDEGENEVTVLTRLGIDAAEWPQARRAWQEELERRIAAEDDDLVVRFARTFQQCRDRLRRQPRAASAAGPLQPQPALVHPDVTADALRVIPAERTPFIPGPATAFLASLDAQRDPPRARPTSEDETAALPAILTDTNETLPFVKLPALQAPREAQLAVEPYASLCAELSVYPERGAEILRRYGLDGEPARRALDRAWAGTFATDPQARGSWEAMFSRFRAWLLTQRR